MAPQWVVNQGKTYPDEFEGGYLWAPLADKAGRKRDIYTNLTKMKVGETFYSNVKGVIRAVGRVIQEAVTCKNPLTNNKDDWIEDGWMVRVEYTELETCPSLKEHIDRVRPLLPEKHQFIWPDGRLPYSGYVFAISEGMAGLLEELVGNQCSVVDEDAIEKELGERTDISVTEIQRLVKARCGQGRYRMNVFETEKACRITGVRERDLLIASHIKPWAKCSDIEKLDGCNGLMLTPNADKLFDRGFISFGDDGILLVSPHVEISTLQALGIHPEKNVGKFNPRQCEYLKYHREHVFKN